MPRDNLPLVADENRVGEAKPLDAVGNLAQLLFRVGARVARVWLQRADRQHLDGGGCLHFLLLIQVEKNNAHYFAACNKPHGGAPADELNPAPETGQSWLLMVFDSPSKTFETFDTL